MPLTIAHPAAVLPLRRCGLPLSALIVGSMAPDLEYLLHLAPRSEISHTPAGLLVFCIPAGMVGLWLFHRVWKRPVAVLIGASWCGSVGKDAVAFTFWPLRRFVMLCAAILVGAMTHVAWDSFTHQYGWAVQRLPLLSRPVLQTQWGPVPLFKVLQHCSTVVGVAVLAYMALHGRAWWMAISGVGVKVFFGVLAVSGVLGVCLALLKTGWPSDFRATKQLVGVSVVAFGVVLIGMVTLESLLWHMGEKKSEPPPTN